MFPLAHIASAVACNRTLNNDRRMAPSIWGALLPDAVDKSLCWVLRVTDSSHHIAHTPLAALALWPVIARFFGQETARSLTTAYIAHLIGDEIHHGRVPWFMPFSSFRRRGKGESNRALFLALELPAALALVVLARPRKPDTI